MTLNCCSDIGLDIRKSAVWMMSRCADPKSVTPPRGPLCLEQGEPTPESWDDSPDLPPGTSLLSTCEPPLGHRDDPPESFPVQETRDSVPSCNGFLSSGLSIEGRAKLRAIPPGLKIDQGLEVVRCPDLQIVSAGLKVRGDSWFLGLSSLRQMRGPLVVSKSLMIIGCQALESLPDDLIVGGDLALVGCPSLVRFPSRMRVAGAVTVRDCPKLLGPIPACAWVGGRYSNDNDWRSPGSPLMPLGREWPGQIRAIELNSRLR